jgi:hypothetical protein
MLNVSNRRSLLGNPIYWPLRALLVCTRSDFLNLGMFVVFMRASLTSVFFGAFVFSTLVQFSLFQLGFFFQMISQHF